MEKETSTNARMGFLRAAIIACLGPGPYPWRTRAAAGWIALFVLLVALPPPLLARAAPDWFTWHPERLAHLFLPVTLRALKEEILFRAVPYALLCLWWGRLSERSWLFLGATVFAVAHEVNFTWVRHDPLTAATLASLFFFGVSTGALFLKQRHIGGCLVVHAGWNLMRFQLEMGVGGRPLTVGEGFHLLEGHPATIAASLACAILLVRALPTPSSPPAASAPDVPASPS